MTKNFNYIFQYLEKEEITIDKIEFEFQIQSHPDYPSLLSIADTLSFFNIDNFATRIDKNQMDDLPMLFIALLHNELDQPSLFLVEKKGDNYSILKDKKEAIINRQELEQRWAEIVLLVEKPNIEQRRTKKNNCSWVLLVLFILVFSSVLFLSNVTSKEILFLLFPLAGILFSVAALKDLFGAKSKLINNFCNITASTSCKSVVDSSKWRVFEIINFSDLSIVFFSFQFMGLFFSVLTNSIDSFHTIQKTLLVFSLPVIWASLYYQKFVEKKWCPICLVIIGIILLEIIFSFLLIKSNFNVSIVAFSIYSFVLISSIIAWYYLKQLLSTNKKLKEGLFKATRFERNYDNFKSNLLAKPQVGLPYSPIILGNKKSRIVLSIISNPFCGHCKKAHEILDKILERHYQDVCVNVFLKSDFLKESEESKKLFRSLYKLYDYNKHELFLNGMKFWFNNTNLEKWSEKYNLTTDFTFDEIINSQNIWCEVNNINFTPAIFINGYEFPSSYDRETLQYFINDLIEDEF